MTVGGSARAVFAARAALCALTCGLAHAQTSPLPDLTREQIRTLHTTVISDRYDLSGDPEPARLLATLYAAGKGVERDDITACALAIRAASASNMAVPRPNGPPAHVDRAAEGDAFVARFCDPLTVPQLRAAQETTGCLNVGMREEIVMVGAAQVHIGRDGIGLVDGSPARRIDLPHCAMAISGIRAVTAAASSNRPTVGGRHFVEALYWRAAAPAARQFVLVFVLLEVRGDAVEVAGLQEVLGADGWPDSPLPIGASYELLPDGSVSYELTGAVHKRGSIPPPPISLLATMPAQLYMIVERFKGGDAAPVYRRFRDRGRLAPPGLTYVSSWVDTPLERCFQLMETEDPRLIDEWIAQWSDLVDFEVYPVIASAEAAARIAPRL